MSEEIKENIAQMDDDEKYLPKNLLKKSTDGMIIPLAIK